MIQQQSRRHFLQTNTAIAAATWSAISASRVLGANERLAVAIIGCGERGRNSHIKDISRFADAQNAQITAICDVWEASRKTASKMIEDRFGDAPKPFTDYQELLAQNDIDAVTIATPEHQHITQLIAACKAGKDVYCEKPLAMNMNELKRGVDFVKQSGRIVQIGTQLRSYPSFTGCKKIVEDGQLGRILKVEQVRNISEPYWFRYVADIKESETDWDLFLQKAPKRPFDGAQHTGWYGYREFSMGSVAAMMCHYIDLAHYITGKTHPISAVGMEGKYAYQDDFTNPDSVQVILEYPGFLVSYSSVYGNGFGSHTTFYGDKGSIDATNWEKPIMTGEYSKHPDRIKEEAQVPDVPMKHHMENWLECLRTRKTPHANIDAGYQHAVACILANQAISQNTRMYYDHQAREIKTG